jgi:hypothetical protein
VGPARDPLDDHLLTPEDAATALPAGAGDGTGEHLPAGGFHLPDDPRLARFVGGAPPPGDGPHRYVIEVQALGIEKGAQLQVEADSTPAWLGFTINTGGQHLTSKRSDPCSDPASDLEAGQDLNLRPLGYEPYDCRLWRPGQSQERAPSSGSRERPVLWSLSRLSCRVAFRVVSFTNPFADFTVVLAPLRNIGFGMEDSLTVLAWVEAAWPGRSWTGAQVLHGAFHEVVLAKECAARVASGLNHRARVDREAQLLRAATQLGLTCSVPLLADGPVNREDRSGVLTTVVPGALREADQWHEVRDGLLTLLDEFAAARPVDGQAMPMARMWCGGLDWPEIVEDRLGRHVPPSVIGRAVAVVADVVAVERESSLGFVHGDFGLHNVLWRSGAACGLIDFDHFGWGDPAIDVAPLVGNFSVAQLSGDFERDLLRRAMFHRASLSLQVASAAELTGDVALRDHALANFVHRARTGTLYDPAGSCPAGRTAAAQRP